MKKNKFYTEHNGMHLNVVRRKAVNEFNELVYSGDINVVKVTDCFCRNADFELLSRFDRYGLPFGTQICRKCGLISQTIRIDENSMPLFYEKIYWDLIWGGSDSATFSGQLSGRDDFIIMLQEIIDFDTNVLNIMEVGCGQADPLIKLGNVLKARYQLKLMGCDFSTEALGVAREGGVDVVQGGMEVLLDKGIADILILSHVFEHFVDLRSSLELIDKLTHDNSIIYVEVPGVADLKNKSEYCYDYQDYSILAHVHNFSLGSLTNVFAARDYKLVKGTEYVRAIYRKRTKNKQEVSNNSYNEIMIGLQETKLKYVDYMKWTQNPVKKYVKGVAKALLGRV
jgi:hypothetical protein